MENRSLSWPGQEGYVEKVGFELGLRKIGGIDQSGEERAHFWQKLKCI